MKTSYFHDTLYRGTHDLVATILPTYLVNLCYSYNIKTVGHLLFEYYSASRILQNLESIDSKKIQNFLIENTLNDFQGNITIGKVISYDYPISKN